MYKSERYLRFCYKCTNLSFETGYVAVLFLDIKGAYASVNLIILTEIMMHFGIPNNKTEIIINLFLHIRIYVR